MKVLAEIPLDGFRLGGGFDYDEILAHGNATTTDARLSRSDQWIRKSVKPAGVVRENQILHSRIGLFLAGLTEQDHHNDPLNLLYVDVIRS